MTRRRKLPLVYACSGCSDVAQLANDAAVQLDHTGRAEMSCISGVGGGVPALVQKARSGRPIIGIDGCQLHCVSACLKRCGVEMNEHVRLYEQGYKKRIGRKVDEQEVDRVVARVNELIDLLNLDLIEE